MECKLAEKAAKLSRQRLEEVKGQVEALLMKELPSEDQEELRELLRLEARLIEWIAKSRYFRPLKKVP